jgi:hypothetical protein
MEDSWQDAETALIRKGGSIFLASLPFDQRLLHSGYLPTNRGPIDRPCRYLPRDQGAPKNYSKQDLKVLWSDLYYHIDATCLVAHEADPRLARLAAVVPSRASLDWLPSTSCSSSESHDELL